MLTAIFLGAACGRPLFSAPDRHQTPLSRIEWGQHREKDGDREMEEDSLAGEARTLDDSLGYILAVIGSVLLSYRATALQRDGVCLALAGDDAGARDAQERVRRLRLLSGAVLIGALGYFLCLALRAADQARGDPGAEGSARTNLAASLLVLLAALLRFLDQKGQAA